MTHVVTEACIGVKGQGCMEVCPAHCIFGEPGDHMSFIDPARCIDCGACMDACVVGAIFPLRSVPRASLEFIELNAQWFGHRSGVRARVRELGEQLGQLLPPGVPPAHGRD
jgi:ferredoxin--NADP+ reductase